MGKQQSRNHVTDESAKPVYSRHGRRSDEDIRRGLEEYQLFKDEGDERAIRAQTSSRGGSRTYDC